MKLNEKVLFELWGDGGPYSEVNIIFQTRILDTKESRSFMEIEAVINPTTFRVCKQNRESFLDDELILQILDYADYRGKYGYFIQAGPRFQIMSPNDFPELLKEAESHKQKTLQKIIRMHDFTMDLLEIKR